MSDPIEVVDEKVQPPQGLVTSYSASSIVLYGVVLGKVNATVGPSPRPRATPTENEIVMQTYPVNVPIGTPPDHIVALIYGYAYQGHCYSLPEPVALVVPRTTEEPAVGCGYPNDGSFNYRMWTVDKLAKTVQVQMTNDTFEELLLRRNMAGARPPLSYRASWRLAHRGGQLTE
jgi:hypothetical protein